MVGGLPLPQEWAEHRPRLGKSMPIGESNQIPSFSIERTADSGVALAAGHRACRSYLLRSIEEELIQ
jgi:hypothetical protein